MSDSWPAPLETLTIRPCSLRRSSGSTAWASRQAPNSVRLHRLVGVVERRLRDVGRHLARHAGVVDQRVEAAGLGFHPLAKPLDAARVGDVELLRLERQPPAVRELLRGPLGGGRVARGDDHVMPQLRELPRDLAPDAPIRAADERHAPLPFHERHTTRP